MPPEGSTKAGRILPGRPCLNRGSRVAEVGFEPRTFRSGNIDKPPRNADGYGVTQRPSNDGAQARHETQNKSRKKLESLSSAVEVGIYWPEGLWFEPNPGISTAPAWITRR
ncbi:hypothetical protein T265_08296 [Opisthorchis viverrini]|uniref:Uncharacterized protein n=1 Tax=Opisthorchis viverrini TaxID=6198 RepID=A0A074Z9M7_OPIVI|nr:hypothetical protein T265_08296 [Opisthorchis viverrini]KER23936.1 hypothetical protein T265_08296 [Opisthorchis viverrini]